MQKCTKRAACATQLANCNLCLFSCCLFTCSYGFHLWDHKQNFIYGTV